MHTGTVSRIFHFRCCHSDALSPHMAAPPASYVCRICKSPGHYICECPSASGYVCKRCHVSGHAIQHCPLNVSLGPPPGYECHRCHAKDHFIQACPALSTDRQQKPDRNASDRHHQVIRSPAKLPPATYVCRLCNTPGHYIKDCPSAQYNAPSQDPTAE